jgi:hypothetical protein
MGGTGSYPWGSPGWPLGSLPPRSRAPAPPPPPPSTPVRLKLVSGCTGATATRFRSSPIRQGKVKGHDRIDRQARSRAHFLLGSCGCDGRCGPSRSGTHREGGRRPPPDGSREEGAPEVLRRYPDLRTGHLRGEYRIQRGARLYASERASRSPTASHAPLRGRSPCRGRGYGEVFGPGEPGARLRGVSFAHGGGATKRLPLPHLRRATLSPPAPFSGSASLSRSGNSVSPIWKGNLRLAFAGRDAELAGLGVHVSIGHARFPRSNSANVGIGF